MKLESDLFKQTAEEHRAEVERLRSATAETQQQGQAALELEQRIQEKEQKFQKMKAIYDGLREEHIKADRFRVQNTLNAVTDPERNWRSSFKVG